MSTIANVDAKDFSDLACWLIVQIGPIAIRGHSIGPTAQQIESIAQAFYKAARDKTVPPAKRLCLGLKTCVGEPWDSLFGVTGVGGLEDD